MLPGGALSVRPGGSFISGYFGNITALGLASVNLHPETVLAWMQWYVSHAHGSGSGVDGVADDGSVLGDGSFRTRGRPDSTDAYGATFLMLARRAYARGDPGLRRFLRLHRYDVERIAHSILATQQSNGLTLARPQHRIAYAIDNEQVYRGLSDGAWLMRQAYGDAEQARLFETRAGEVARGISGILWDPATRTFRPEVDAPGNGPPADLSRAYPDALAQAYAIVYGVVDARSALAASLLSRAAPALANAPAGDAVEYRLVLALAQRAAGTNAVAVFQAPPICADAGWYLQVTNE